MSDSSISQIKQSLKQLYPQLFDDRTAKDKLDPLITQADMAMNPFKGNIDSKQYRQLVQLMAAHLLYQSEDHDISSFHVADVSYTASNNSKTNNSSNDPYMSQLLNLLSLLGINQEWGIQLG